jgi:hypothetical protein
VQVVGDLGDNVAAFQLREQVTVDGVDAEGGAEVDGLLDGRLSAPTQHQKYSPRVRRFWH